MHHGDVGLCMDVAHHPQADGGGRRSRRRQPAGHPTANARGDRGGGGGDGVSRRGSCVVVSLRVRESFEHATMPSKEIFGDLRKLCETLTSEAKGA
jgi:hypothetical protein